MTKNEAGADEDVILEDLPADPADGEEDKTDWKAIAKKNHGIAKRFETKFKKSKESKGSEGEGGSGKGGEGDGSKGSTLDRMDRAILRVEKITDSKEVELVENWMKESGKTLEQVLESKYFQNELKELREFAATEAATPEGGSKRSGAQTKDTVDYWLARPDGKLPEDPVLRTKVVNAKIAKEKNQSQFSSNPLG